MNYQTRPNKSIGNLNYTLTNDELVIFKAKKNQTITIPLKNIASINVYSAGGQHYCVVKSINNKKITIYSRYFEKMAKYYEKPEFTDFINKLIKNADKAGVNIKYSKGNKGYFALGIVLSGVGILALILFFTIPKLTSFRIFIKVAILLGVGITTLVINIPKTYSSDNVPENYLPEFEKNE